jgi:hypothetical protein
MTMCAKFLSNVCSGRGNLNTVHPSRTFASNGDYCLSAKNDKERVGCILDEVNDGTIRLDRHASRRQAGRQTPVQWYSWAPAQLVGHEDTITNVLALVWVQTEVGLRSHVHRVPSHQPHGASVPSSAM